MRQKLWMVLIVTLLTTTLHAKKIALLVGVNNVRGANALFTDIDIQTISSMLKAYDFEIIPLTRERASLSNLRGEFKKLYKRLNPNDIFLFYYTGHGARMRGANLKEKADNFFVLNRAYFSNSNTIGGGVMTDKEFSNHLYKIRAKKISIVDACHSGTIYKSLSNHSHIKSILSKGEEGIFERGADIGLFYAKPLHNFINISATKDDQQAENSPKGSPFTLALVDTIKKNPSITFRELEKKVRWKTKQTALTLAQTFPRTSIYSKLAGGFTPVLKTIPKKFERLLVKDVFSKGGRFTLDSLFNQPPTHKKVKLHITSDQKSYHNSEQMIINIKSSLNRGYLYLFEKKSDRYIFLGEKKLSKCSKSGSTSYCQFKDLYASTPYGKSTVHAILTKNRLNIEGKALKKDFEITEEFFDEEESLAIQIKKERVDGVSLVLHTTP